MYMHIHTSVHTFMFTYIDSGSQIDGNVHRVRLPDADAAPTSQQALTKIRIEAFDPHRVSPFNLKPIDYATPQILPATLFVAATY